MPAIGIGPRSVARSGRALAGMAFAQSVRIERSGKRAMAPDLPRLEDGIPVDRTVYARLNRWAVRTYVPESSESRTRGAGAGDLVETD